MGPGPTRAVRLGRAPRRRVIGRPLGRDAKCANAPCLDRLGAAPRTFPPLSLLRTGSRRSPTALEKQPLPPLFVPGDSRRLLRRRCHIRDGIGCARGSLARQKEKRKKSPGGRRGAGSRCFLPIQSGGAFPFSTPPPSQRPGRGRPQHAPPPLAPSVVARWMALRRLVSSPLGAPRPCAPALGRRRLCLAAADYSLTAPARPPWCRRLPALKTRPTAAAPIGSPSPSNTPSAPSAHFPSWSNRRLLVPAEGPVPPAPPAWPPISSAGLAHAPFFFFPFLPRASLTEASASPPLSAVPRSSVFVLSHIPSLLRT